MKVEKILNWLKSERLKDETEVKIYKQRQIKEIKGLSKEDIFGNKKTKLTIWQRLKKTLMGF